MIKKTYIKPKSNKTIIKNGVCYCRIAGGGVVKYDSKFYEFFKDKRIFVSGSKLNNSGRKLSYAVFTYNGIKWKLHRYVIGAKEGEIVDHINRDTMDNTLNNLRIVTFVENMANRDYKATSVTGYRCVYPAGKRFRASTRISGKNYHIGRFDTPLQAAKAYDAWALKELGEKAITNKRLGLY